MQPFKILVIKQDGLYTGRVVYDDLTFRGTSRQVGVLRPNYHPDFSPDGTFYLRASHTHKNHRTFRVTEGFTDFKLAMLKRNELINKYFEQELI